MMPARRPVLLAAAVGIVLSGVVTLVMLWPALGSGYLLYRDFITVPDPALGPRTWGMTGSAPRAVPLDAVMALADPVVPTWLQQKLILFGSLWGAGSGVAVLLRNRGVLAAAVGGVVATWSPFAAERLLLGQAPTLLAWSALPWLVLASRYSGWAGIRVPLLLVAALPAALTPSGGLTAAAAVVVLSLLWRRSRAESTVLAAIGLGWCLPWVIAALGGRTDAGVSEGAAAFRVEVAGPAEVLDVFTGGGVWAEGARLASRDGRAAGSAMLVLLVMAAVGLTAVAGARRRVLAIGLFLPPIVALGLASPLGLPIFAAAQAVPGVALFRDTHRLLALSAFVLSLLVPLGAVAVLDQLGRRIPRGAALPLTAMGVFCVSTALVVLAAPDIPRRLQGAYRPVEFPKDWHRAVRAAGEGPVLVLPWQPMRQVPWNGDRPFLDPLSLALPGDVVAASDLVVQRGSERYQVGSSDPLPAAQWAAGRVDLATLRSQGIAIVMEWRGSPGAAPRTDGLRLLTRTSSLSVWRVP
ncbi:hypothetical protein [Intrasporangium calvum]|nr:hypothetical protein [Intrasporangium calvum]